MKLKDKMVEELNLQLEKEGSCLRYIKVSEDIISSSYRVTVIDKFVSTEENDYSVPNITKELDDFVRKFFLINYKVDNTGFSNSVVTLITWN